MNGSSHEGWLRSRVSLYVMTSMTRASVEIFISFKLPLTVTGQCTGLSDLKVFLTIGGVVYTRI